MGECRQYTSEAGRWDCIDLMKFLGIFFVLIYHSNTYSCSWLNDGSSLSLFRYFLRTLLSTCVPLFFFASGYLLLNRQFSLKKHVIRLGRTVVLTGLWGVITIALLMPIDGNYLSAKDFVRYLWGWQQGWVNHLWFMGALSCLYVFFPLLKSSFDNNRGGFVFFTACCALFTFGNTLFNHIDTMMANWLGLYNGIIVKNWFNIFNPLRGIYGYSLVYFCVGGLAHGLKGKIEGVAVKKRNAVAIVAIVLCCCGLFTTGVILSNISGSMWDVVWNGYDTVFTLISVFMIFVLCLNFKGMYFIRLVSENTLGIYFLHIMFIHLTKKYVVQLSMVTTFMGCAVYAFSIMLCCLLITQLMRRLPILRELVRL